MDDLISRKALYDAMEKREEMYAKGNCLYDAYNYHVSAEIVANAPSVPAVPLDKLCRMLAKYIGFPCNYSPIDEEMADYCGDQCEMDDIGCWEKVLSKWMEG